jgi:hypothetical protein
MQSPDPSQFTCHVTLKNVGNMKAVGVQVEVTPFRNAGEREDNDSHIRTTVQPDRVAPLISQWVAFPDLDPGQTVTRDAVFGNHPGVDPAENLNPQIIFQSEKVAPPAPSGPAFPHNL